MGTPGASRLPTMASCDTPRAPLCWERLRKGCPKLATAANGLIFERMASDGKKSNLVHHCRLCACLGGTPPGGGLRPPPLGARGSPAAPEAVATASGGGCPTGWRPKDAPPTVSPLVRPPGDQCGKKWEKVITNPLAQFSGPSPHSKVESDPPPSWELHGFDVYSPGGLKP